MATHSKRYKLDAPPKKCLDDRLRVFVDNFKYLGHIISCDFTDNVDIMRKVRKFFFCLLATKLYWFRAFCHSLYCFAFWSNFRKETLYMLNVCYNNIMRRLSSSSMAWCKDNFYKYRCAWF